MSVERQAKMRDLERDNVRVFCFSYTKNIEPYTTNIFSIYILI